jgi:hypothetical protein
VFFMAYRLLFFPGLPSEWSVAVIYG